MFQDPLPDAAPRGASVRHSSCEKDVAAEEGTLWPVCSHYAGSVAPLKALSVFLPGPLRRVGLPAVFPGDCKSPGALCSRLGLLFRVNEGWPRKVPRPWPGYATWCEQVAVQSG